MEAGILASSIMSILSLQLYNILSIYTLTTTLTDKKLNLIAVAQNPLIIGIVLGIMINLLHIPVAPVLAEAGDYLGATYLPLALLAVVLLYRF
jgi:predicted permease